MKPDIASYQKTHSVYTEPAVALSCIHERRLNTEIFKEVARFLNDDIPHYFNSEKPICYLARHVATPNYETLRFIELAKDLELPAVIGQDQNDLFVSNNVLKRALGKPPVTKGTARNGDEIREYFTVVDFGKEQGKKIRDISTVTGTSLVEFHNSLLREVYPENISMVDDSEWIDRNHRGNLIKHYEHLLALLLVHGVMFEFYEPQEQNFVETILIPAMNRVEEHFGLRPLICPLVDPAIMYERNWNGYPSIIYQLVKRQV